jgi:hypothetical protein
MVRNVHRLGLNLARLALGWIGLDWQITIVNDIIVRYL